MATKEEREAEQDRSVAIGLLAVFFLFLAGLWSGLASDLFLTLTLVLALGAGIFLIKAGAPVHDVIAPTLGSALILAVLVPFFVHFATGTTDPADPWLPVVAAIVSPVVAWVRLGPAERVLALLGAGALLAFLLADLGTALDLTSMTVAALLLMVALATAVPEPPER